MPLVTYQMISYAHGTDGGIQCSGVRRTNGLETQLDQEIRVERRTQTRYLVRAPALFRWEESHGVPRSIEAETRDIGVAGAYVVSAICPPLSTTVDIEVVITMPSAPLGGRLRGRMRVVRLDGQAGRNCTGFALSGDPFVVGGEASGPEEEDPSPAKSNGKDI